MTVLFHCQDIASDAAEGVRSSGGTETSRYLLLDFPPPQGRARPDECQRAPQRLSKASVSSRYPPQPVEQVLAFARLPGAAAPTRREHLFPLFFHAGLQDGGVALLVVA